MESATKAQQIVKNKRIFICCSIPCLLNFLHIQRSKKSTLSLDRVLFLSARRGSNPRPPPWQGGAPPLSHSRISYGFPPQQKVCYHISNFKSISFAYFLNHLMHSLHQSDQVCTFSSFFRDFFLYD